MLAMYVPVNLGYVAILNFMLWPCCGHAYGLVRCRHKNHLVRLGKRSCFGLKYSVLSPQTQLENVSKYPAVSCLQTHSAHFQTWHQHLHIMCAWYNMYCRYWWYGTNDTQKCESNCGLLSIYSADWADESRRNLCCAACIFPSIHRYMCSAVNSGWYSVRGEGAGRQRLSKQARYKHVVLIRPDSLLKERE